MKHRLRAVLEELRHQNKVLNQTDFGKKLDYNKTYISGIMNNDDLITDSFLSKLQKKFDVNPEFVRKESEQMFISTSNNDSLTEKDLIQQLYGRLGDKDRIIEGLQAQIMYLTQELERDKSRTIKIPDSPGKEPGAKSGN